MKKPRLLQTYLEKVRAALMEKRQYKNLHEVPRLEKIVLNMGVSASLDKAAIDDAAKDLGLITGRKPVVSKSRKSVANFKLRQGQPIGCHVTLRREVMYEFLDRLVAAALPRIRDFRGLSPRCFDGRGNYSVGVADQTIFPEIDLDKIKRQQGMDITIVTTAKTDAEALDLLKMMGMPFAEGK
ncbi:MAG: 50S ribosomal protein L5 [Verrucomicrobia bacterium]|nr:50S ribosomal protein L5 [Verrucomicrobiota bacterium]